MAGRTSITARRFFDGTSMRGPTEVVLDDGIVVSIRDHAGAPEHEWVIPGLVDLQVNGWDSVDFAAVDAESFRRIDSELASMGTTSYLATLVTDSLDRMHRRASNVDALAREAAPGCFGIHLEGPFLGKMPGAHRTDMIRDVDPGWLDTLPRSVRLVTMAAEQPGFARGAEILASRGAVTSIGHTAPTAPEFAAAVSAGARMVTHLFNAMSGVHHRDFGVALAALTDDRLVAGLISDGQHVAAAAVSLAFAAKPGRIALVSDSVAWRSPWAAASGIELRDGAPRLPGGSLAGSSTSLAGCVRHSITECGVPPVEAFRAATSVPASVLGRDDMGRIATGLACDIVAFDSAFCVSRTWRRLQSSRGTQTDS